MTTLREAQQVEDWGIVAKLVNKLIFVKRRQDGPSKIALILVFIDTDGQSFEIKLWRNLADYDKLRKIFTVYRKAEENNFYEVQRRTSTPGNFFRAPNAEFSTAKLEYSRGWWIEPIEANMRMKRYLDCSTNIQSSLSTLQQKRPVNIMGSYVSHRLSDFSKNARGRSPVLGYFVTLMDDSGRQFIALVWHASRVDRKFCLADCDRGAPVLLFSARRGFVPNDMAKDMISLTTCYRPVVNSECVSSKRINALREAFRSAYHEINNQPTIAYALSAQVVA